MIPHAQRLGLSFVETSSEFPVIEMPYSPDLENLPGTGLMANGVITTFLDTALGACASGQFEELRRVATLDLRVDYFETPKPYSNVRAKTRCLKVSDEIVFVQAEAYCVDEGRPFAHAVGAFSHMPFHFPDGSKRDAETSVRVGQI